MNWGRFKNIAIICFIVLNIALGILISDKKDKTYNIQDIQIERVKKIFEAQDLGLYTALPKSYYPMSMIKLKNIETSLTEISKDFFGTTNGIKNNIDSEKIILYIDETSEVDVYKNGVVKYKKNKVTAGQNKYDKNQSRKIADKFIESLNFVRRKNYYNQAYTTNEGYVVEYNSRYNNKTVFSNYIRVLVKNNEVVEAVIQNYEIEGYANEQREIYSADEALINLMYEVKHDYQSKQKDLHVMGFDIGYYINPKTLDDITNIKAEPYYRVLINEKDIYYINAYTNEIVKEIER